MKKNRKLSLTLAAALALTALTACGSLSASAAIDAAGAKRIAAEHLGRDVSELRVLECERDDGKYEMEVLVDGVKYDFEIGASSGKVLEWTTATMTTGTTATMTTGTTATMTTGTTATMTTGMTATTSGTELFPRSADGIASS